MNNANYTLKTPHDFEERLSSILNTKYIQHEEAKAGSEALNKLDAPVKLRVFLEILDEKKHPSDVAYNVYPYCCNADKKVTPNDLTAALRRLSFTGIPLYNDFKVYAPEEEPPKSPTVGMSYKPGVSLQEHIRNAEGVSKSFDGITKMANLAAILEQQFKTVYTHVSREQNPFLFISNLNAAAGTYMAALEKLHHMQIDVGIVTKAPEKMELDVSSVGAFQTYIGELETGAKEEMVNFANSFKKFVEDKRAKRNGSGSGD